MSQHDHNIADADGATVRADMNSLFQAMAEANSGPTAPSTTFAYMWWANTSTGVLNQRNAANTNWIAKGTLANAITTIGDALLNAASAAAARATLDAAGLSVTNEFIENQIVKRTGASSGGLTLGGRNKTIGNTVGQIFFIGDNDADEQINYGGISSLILDDTDGAEDGRVAINVMKNGTLANQFFFGQGLYGSSTIGGDKGLDTINVKAIFIDGVVAPLPAPGYNSGNQALTPSTVLSLTHGLGVIPSLVQVVLKCVTAEKGYSIDDEVSVGAAWGVSQDATEVVIVQPASIQIYSQTTQAVEQVTSANWKWIARAWV